MSEIKNEDVSLLHSFENIITNHGFTKDGDVFYKELLQVQQRSLNGRNYTEEIKHKLNIELLGEGYISNGDDTNKTTLYNFHFSVVDMNNSEHKILEEVTMSFNDTKEFVEEQTVINFLNIQ